MGMAAGQARLLSITSRMSDNELRAQIINNNKMRLATESSQASEAYIAALNEAELMFTNYDADNNASYQQLTFNALSTFNPYNNQYALINSSGNVLLSEKDAEIYRNCNHDLTTFLQSYGLEQTTTYFDMFPTSAEGGLSFKDIGYNNLSISSENLFNMYFGSDSDITVGGVNIGHNSYINNFNSDTRYQYEKYLLEYTTSKDNYTSLLSGVMANKFKSLLKEKCGWESISDAKNAINAEDMTVEKMSKIFDNISNLSVAMGDSALTGGTDTATEYFDEIADAINNNNSTFVKENLTSAKAEDDDSRVMWVVDDSNKTFLASVNEVKDSENNTSLQIDEILYFVNGDKIEAYDKTKNETTTNGGRFQEHIASGTSVSDGYIGYYDSKPTITVSNWSKGEAQSIVLREEEKEGDTIKVAKDERTFYILQNSDGNEYPDLNFNLSLPNDLENMQSSAISILESLEESISSIWDVDNSDQWLAKVTAEDISDDDLKSYKNITGNNDITKKELAEIRNANISATFTTAYDSYIEDAENLGNVIFNNYNADNMMKFLDDLPYLYNKYKGNFTDKFKETFGSLLLDEVMNLYGEPQIAWIDKSAPTASYNNNGDAKARWYENLFNRIESGGYKVLQDGLASSPEWIEFAFESGIVTMEQVDSYNAWNPLIYSNCSDIISQTSDKNIAKAEAEYNAAMNKIENKDKRYDLELKNIDTEHNSLQVEYESIKTAIDKNVERTFKLYS